MSKSTALPEQVLAHPDGETTISIGTDLPWRDDPRLAAWIADRTAFVVTSPKLRELYGPVIEQLGALARVFTVLEVPDGESAKSLEHAGRLWREMLAAGGKRDSRLITFGGGSVGDLGGFVAGCFLRGIEYLQIPTTLLAQVDASVGGKTAVDLEGGKNTVGLFHHPHRVMADTRFLETLPHGELRSGLVEAIKMAALLAPPLLETVESQLSELMAGDSTALAPVVAGAVAAKRGVVEADPAEGGWRRILNYGHTLGHAIEGALSYCDLRHGEAVAYGMLFANRLALQRGMDPELDARLRLLLKRLELPPLPKLDPETLVDYMSRDKKAAEGGLTWVLPLSLGEGHMVKGIEADEVRAELETFLRSPFGQLV